MRDASFRLDAVAATQAAPPFSYRFVNRPWPAPSWTIREGRNRQVATARTRAGARAAVRALYANAERPSVA